MDNKNHIRQCKELMQESASKVNLHVDLEEYKEETKEGKFIEGIEINLRDKDRYLIYKAYNNVSQILGFIDGYKYNRQ